MGFKKMLPGLRKRLKIFMEKILRDPEKTHYPMKIRKECKN